MRRRMPARPPGAGTNTHSGNVPAVPDTSTFRVASRAADGSRAEPPPITRTSMSALEGRRRSRRRTVVVAVSAGVVLVLAAGIYLVYALATGDASAAEAGLIASGV